MAGAYDKVDVLESVLLRPFTLHLGYSFDKNWLVEIDGSGYVAPSISYDDWEFSTNRLSAKLKNIIIHFSAGLPEKVKVYGLARPGTKKLLSKGTFPDGGYDVWRPGDSIEVSDVIRF